MQDFVSSVKRAVVRAKAPVAWMALTYALGVAAGAVMVHQHNSFALGFRDRLVGHAVETSPILLNLEKGFPVRAALLDFGANLGLGAAPSTMMGLSVAMPFPLAAFRGWVGGVVSVDDAHQSRLAGREGLYYWTVLILQLIPYSLAGGAGVRLGLGFLLPRSRWGYAGSKKWLTIPADGVRDVGRMYVLIAPLFLVASLVEFLAR
jgi:hypothetical protein